MKSVLLVIERADYRETAVHGPFDSEDDAERHALSLGFIYDVDGELVLGAEDEEIGVIRPVLEPESRLGIIGRERALIDKLTTQIQRDGVRGHASRKANLEGRRHGSFEVLIHVDGQPTGHVALVTVELDRLDPEIAEQYAREQAARR